MVNKDQVESWRESLYRVYRSGQQSMRVAVYGTKHDASLFEELLKAASQFEPLGTIGDTMIDTACLNIPKVTLTLTLNIEQEKQMKKKRKKKKKKERIDTACC